MNILERITSIIGSISRVAAYISAAATVLLILLILAEIAARAFLNSSLGLTLVVSGWLLVLIGFMGFAWTLKSDGHVRLIIITSRFSEYVQFWISFCINIVCIFVFGFLTILCFLELINQYQVHSTSTSVIRLPMWWAWISVVIGLSVFTLQFLGITLEDIISIRKSKGK